MDDRRDGNTGTIPVFGVSSTPTDRDTYRSSGRTVGVRLRERHRSFGARRFRVRSVSRLACERFSDSPGRLRGMTALRNALGAEKPVPTVGQRAHLSEITVYR